MLRRTATLTVTLAGALALGPLGAPLAQAAPLTVQQSPAIGTGISGLLIPGPVQSRVTAESTADPNTVRLGGTASQEHCATTFNLALIRIDWRNAGNGRVGSVTVKACPTGYNPEIPQSTVVNTGPGKLTFVQTITGSRERWSAGLPATPGGGTVLR